MRTKAPIATITTINPTMAIAAISPPFNMSAVTSVFGSVDMEMYNMYNV